MIEKIRIRGYRKFRDITIMAADELNIFVGDNESGKSTVLEAINLAMTGRLNGRTAQEELNPFWFNQGIVEEFFVARKAGKPAAIPAISIEIFFHDEDDLQKLAGANNSDLPTRTCPGVELAVEPNADYADEIENHLGTESAILPVEYFNVIWRTFRDQVVTSRPRELTIALIDSRTLRSTSGVDSHVRHMLREQLTSEQRAQVSLAYRSVKEEMTRTHLVDANKAMSELSATLDGEQLSLAMDQSSRSSWELSVIPHVSDLPFNMAGLGQQVAIKIALAMGRSADRARVVTVEEPENHLSHTSLNRLVSRIQELRGDRQQIFISTHSSYVLNRLGLDALRLLSDGSICTFDAISDGTVSYFQKLPGYDTLRLVLADRFTLVEGPSDEVVFERFYRDKYARRPIEDGIDVLSMRGLSPARFLEIAKLLDKRGVVIRDNDGKDPNDIRATLAACLDGSRRELFVSDRTTGATLEPQIVSANDAATLRGVLSLTERADLNTWMTNNKTEAAIRIASSDTALTAPSYMSEAAEFIHDVQ